MATKTNNEAVILDGVLKKKSRSFIGTTKWVETNFQLSTNFFTEFYGKPTPKGPSFFCNSTLQNDSESKSLEEKKRSWPLSSIDVVVVVQEQKKDNSTSKLKIVFQDGTELVMMADDTKGAKKWVEKIKKMQNKQQNDASISPSITRITDVIKNVCDKTLDPIQKGQMERELKTKHFHSPSSIKSLVIEDEKDSAIKHSEESKSFGIVTDIYHTPISTLRTQPKRRNLLVTTRQDKPYSTFASPINFVQRMHQIDTSPIHQNISLHLRDPILGSSQKSIDSRQIFAGRRLTHMASMSENLDGFLQISRAYEDLQNKSFHTEEELEEHRQKAQQLFKKLGEHECEIEEMKNRIKSSKLFSQGDALIERERALETDREKMKSSQLVIITSDTEYQKEKEKDTQMDTRERALSQTRDLRLLQLKKMNFVTEQELKVQQMASTIDQRDISVNREAQQLRKKILLYNQRVIQLNKQAEVIAKAERDAEQTSQELELNVQELEQREARVG